MRQLIENSFVRQHYAGILNIRLADGVMPSAVNGNSNAQRLQLPHGWNQLSSKHKHS